MQIILAKGRGLLRTSSGLTIPHPSSLHHWDYLQHTIPLILWLPEILSELRDITAPLTLVRVLVFSAQVNISPVQAPQQPPPTPAIPPPGQELPSEVWAPSSLPPSPGPASTTANSVPPSTPSSEQPSDNSEAKKAAVTSMETTGPDGQPMLDETSQQSTLSQSSDNSGGRQTPKGGYPQVRLHSHGSVSHLHSVWMLYHQICLLYHRVSCLGLSARPGDSSQRSVTRQHGIISG